MRKISKILLIIFISILSIVLFVVVALQTKWGKNLLRQYLQDFLAKKLETTVEIKSIDYDIPNSLNLNGVLVLDRQKDTLVWLNDLEVKVDMLALLKSKINVSRIAVDGLYGNIYRSAPDTTFNYQFILEAFVSNPDTASSATIADSVEEKTNITYDAGLIELKNIRFNFNDSSGGSYFNLSLGDLSLKPRKIDLDSLAFEVTELQISNVKSSFVSGPSILPPTPEDTTNSDAGLTLVINDLDLNNISFLFESKESNLDFDIQAGNLKGAMPWFSLKDELIKIESLSLANTNAKLVMGAATTKSEETNNVTSDTDTASAGWRITANDLLLKNIGFVMDDNTKPRLANQIDYSHLDISKFYLDLQNLLFSTDTISGNIKNLSLNEKSGLDIQTLATKFIYHSQGAVLDELILKTPHTLLQDKIAVSYRSLDAISNDLGALKLDIGLKNSILDFKDLFLFLPDEQRKMLAAYKKEHLKFNIIANGTVNALNLQQLYAKGLKNTEIDLAGKIFGLPNADKLKYDLNVRKIYSTYNDISAFLPKDLSQSVAVPAWFSATGSISGATTAYNPNLNIKTADGDAAVKGLFAMANGKQAERYNLHLNTHNLNLGKILKMQDQLGTVSAAIDLVGTGLDPKKMNADFNAKVQSAYFNGYNYNNVYAKGFIQNQKGLVELQSFDPNATIDGNIAFELTKEFPRLNGNINIDLIDLQALKFVEEPMTVSGDIVANVESLDLDYPIATIKIDNPFFTMNNETYQIDTFYVKSQPQNGTQDIELNINNILRGKLTGKIPLTQIGNSALAHVNQYYKLSDTITNVPLDYDMNMAATITYHPMIRKFVPQLKPFDTIKLYANILPDNLNAGLFAPGFRYGDMRIDTLSFIANEQDSVLSYVIGNNKFSSGNFKFYNSSISGIIQKDSIFSLVNITDSASVDQFQLGANIGHDSANNQVISLAEGLKLNYTDWIVDPENKIVLGDSGFYIQNLELNYNDSNTKDQFININSTRPEFGSPLDIDIQKFTLSNLTQMLSENSDTLIADGYLNVKGHVDLGGPNQDMSVAANASIDSLKLMGAYLGDLKLDANSTTSNSYAANVSLIGNNNNLNVTGLYHLKPIDSNELDFKLNLQSLDLKSLEPITSGALKDSKGFLFGDIDIKGTPSAPKLNGFVQTNELSTIISQFNEYISLPKERITISSSKGISLDKFSIYDKHNKPLVIDGTVRTRNYTDYFLNLSVNADKWQVMNSTQKNSDWIYGDLIISANANIKGYALAPTIDGTITVHDSSNVTYAMVDEDPSLVSNEGIVEFYDGRDTMEIDSVVSEADKRKMLLAKNASINVNVNVDKDAQFAVVIDPETGDKLVVKGVANLNADIGDDGNFSLAGTYELEDGSYELNYNFIKRKFKIQKGSLIQLAGNPLDATANITAIYETNAAPYDLVQNQTEESGELNYYRQRLPFNVLLKITGQVMKPEINFDLDLSTKSLNTVNESVKSFVESKLTELRNNPSDMNKQVFALLILGRFISDDPFSSGGGAGFEYAARQSASRFLSNQMNQLAGNLVKGLELNMDLNSSEDYSTGNKVNRTDLNISASKRLLNDRLKITIGNDFAIEGQTASDRQATSLIPGNLSAEYMITDDGKYNIRGYRQTELQNIIKGYVVETGLGLKINYEFSKFKYLFINRDKYLEKLRQDRKAREEKERLEELKKNNANVGTDESSKSTDTAENKSFTAK